MRKLLGTLAACLIVGSPLAAAIPAQANSPWFDMVNKNQASDSYLWFIDDSQGAGYQLVMNQTGGTDFQLINENTINGIHTWEIADGIGCMNAANDTGVYINGCNFGQSSEEWIVNGDWTSVENVHRGTSGYLNVDCGNTLISPCPETVVSVAATNPWATPGS